MGHLRNVHKATYLAISAAKTKNKQSNKQISPPEAHKQMSPPDLHEESDQLDDDIMCVEDNELEIPSKRQKTIVASFKAITDFKPKGYKARKINNIILFFICKDNQPLSVVEDEGFQELIKELAPYYKLPSRKTFKRWLHEKNDALSKVVKGQLSEKENITLTTDVWSDSHSMRSFLGVTAHFGEDIKLCSMTLGVYELLERHTSQYISEKLLETCTEWGIPKESISAVVTDNAANMVKAIDLAFGKKFHIPCFAHTINLVAQSILKCNDLVDILSKLKSIVTWFRQSCPASDELRKVTGDGKKLIQEVSTRWNSTYYMMERFMEMRVAINSVINNHITAPTMLNAYEFSIISDVISLLRPLEASTKEVSGDKYTTSSTIIPIVDCMTSKINLICVTDMTTTNVKKALLKDIRDRMGAIEYVTSLAIATVLDPRFKKIHFRDEIACSNAVKKIRDMMRVIESADSDSIESASDSSDKAEESFSLWSDHHKLVNKNWKINKGNTFDTSDEVSIYLKTPVGRLSENPLEIWKDLQIQFPKLYKVAYKYLTIVGSSVPSERLFSKAGQTLSQKRNRLKPQLLNKLLFLQGIDKKYWDIN